MKTVQKIFLFLSLVILFLVFKAPAFAQTSNVITPQPTNTYVTPNTNANVPNNLHTWTQSVMLEVMSSFSCQLTGIDPLSPNQKCLGLDIKTGKIGYVESNGGVLGFATQSIAMLYTPPLHTVDYFRYLSQNFGIAKPAVAATNNGLGFNQLQALIPLWSLFRNITYLFLVIVFILIGVAIMLRVRIDPRTVMTIQNQIPKIIVALILITFSYAIAGFLIDLMYLSIYLIYGIFSSVPGVVNVSPSHIQGKTVLDLASSLNVNQDNGGVFSMAHNVALAGKDTINGFLNVQSNNVPVIDDITGAFNNLFKIAGDWNNFSIVSAVYDTISLITAFKIGAAAANIGSAPIFGTIVGTTVGIAAFGSIEFFLRNLLPYLLIFMIVMIAIIVTLFRLLLMLLMSYISILLDVIFAPLWILGGILPGNTAMGIGPWLRDIIANLSVFPVVYTMFILMQAIGSSLGAVNTGFAPPLLGNPLAPGFLGAITSLGLLLMTPQVAKMTKAALKAPKFELGGAGQSLGVGRAVIAGAAGGAASRFFKVDQNGNPQGPGATWISKRIKRPIARSLLGFKALTPEEIQAAGRSGKGGTANQPKFKRNWRTILKGGPGSVARNLVSRDRPQTQPVRQTTAPTRTTADRGEEPPLPEPKGDV